MRSSLWQHLGHGVYMVEPVEPAPIAVDVLRVVEPVPGRAARVRDEHGESLEREIWINGIENHAKLGRSWLCGPPWT